jgi:RNA polymerase sigma-70 factor (ECF subfamily)
VTEDSKLIEQTLEGDPNAFGQLVERHQAALFNFVYHFVGNYHDAEEITQESFFHAYERLGTFRGRSRFKTWLFSIACRLAYRRKPKTTVMTSEIISLGMNQHSASSSSRGQNRDNPAAALDQQETVRAVREAILELPAPYRLAVLLVDLEGMDYSRAAKTLKIPVNTLRSRLARGREILRRKLAPIL